MEGKVLTVRRQSQALSGRQLNPNLLTAADSEGVRLVGLQCHIAELDAAYRSGSAASVARGHSIDQLTLPEH